LPYFQTCFWVQFSAQDHLRRLFVWEFAEIMAAAVVVAVGWESELVPSRAVLGGCMQLWWKGLVVFTDVYAKCMCR
jgi:hypothetical protein